MKRNAKYYVANWKKDKSKKCYKRVNLRAELKKDLSIKSDVQMVSWLLAIS